MASLKNSGRNSHLEEPKKGAVFFVKNLSEAEGRFTRIPPQQKSTGVRRAVGVLHLKT